MIQILKQACIDTEVIPLSLQETEKNTPLKQAEEKTWEEGYLAGKEAGKILAEEQMLLLKQQLEQALLAIPQAIEKNRLALSTEIADLIMFLMHPLFIEKALNTQALETQINQILMQLNQQQKIELYMHPQEISLLKKNAIKLEAAHIPGLTIKSDEKLYLGGYVLKTEHGLFDASIEKQINNLKEQLLHLRQRGQHALLD